MNPGDKLCINGMECVYYGRVSGYLDGSGPMLDVIGIPSIPMPRGKPVTFAYKPGTWEHRIHPPNPPAPSQPA